MNDFNKLFENLPKTKIELDIPTIPKPDFSEIERMKDQMALERKKKEEKEVQQEKEEKEYREQMLLLLAGIEKNTAILKEISFLVRENNSKQEETFALVVEMLEVLKSTNQEEALSKYRKIMNKISEFNGDTETVKTLYNVGSTIFSMVNTLV
ncbi:hypothetical protein ABEX69_06890 [Bacillus safensis]|uniref:hypothetical protein n=1 Tax=Bacillus safensis TaxID=561879 RepID=UPI00227ED992|nr:hypothetical protein [Bacillus safensis]MCY7563824.1 hypothetical protein [Bacillus safensis]MCY7625466.1 hypothetical protein [Bacillus safensis]MCY7632440.1 hypothetical protein [Bacillus safensis]MCY7646852.1 hypothetical protein [Bacillus safensis]MCY7652582.1 hypothetical protein [Bacillus safensis]